MSAALLCCETLQAQNIVPQPARISMRAGTFAIRGTTTIGCGDAETEPSRRLASRLGMRPESIVRADADYSYNRDRIYLKIDTALRLPAEGYRLSCTSDRVTITGRDYNGLLYGIRTLMQLMPPEVYSGKAVAVSLPCVEIADWPELGYRGVMLDVARTFQPLPVIKRYVDILSCHKINTLHLHLANDEGWRVEIKSHPGLASEGGFRGGDSPVRPIYGAWDRKYGGYYTQDELRELAAYASERGITVVPEIDLPGHSRAAARVYPEILCSYPAAGKYDGRNVWCAAKEDNYGFLSDIIGEVCSIFPSEYIHIGGDEVDFSQWLSCPDCRELMRREGLADGKAVQGYFMRRIAGIVESNGRKAAVWNEAAGEGTLPSGSRVYGWQNTDACRKALAAGYPTVVMPAQYFYIDMRQSPSEPGAVWAGPVSTEKLYSFDFGREELEGDITGVEAALWSETLLSQHPDFLWYQSYPRICALSEIGWNASRRTSYEDFDRRMKESHYARLAAMGIAFRLPPPDLERLDKGNMAVYVPFGGCVLESRYRRDDDTTGWRPMNLIEPLHGRPRLMPSYMLHNNLEFPELLVRAVYRRRGVSPAVGVREPKILTPAVKLTASVPENAKYPYSNVSAYKFWTQSRTSAPLSEGDGFIFAFSRPVRCRSMELITGYYYMPARCLIDGRVEISYEEGVFEDCGPLENGRITLWPEHPVRAVRIVAGPSGSGGEAVVIYAPLIRAAR